MPLRTFSRSAARLGFDWPCPTLRLQLALGFGYGRASITFPHTRLIRCVARRGNLSFRDRTATENKQRRSDDTHEPIFFTIPLAQRPRRRSVPMRREGQNGAEQEEFGAISPLQTASRPRRHRRRRAERWRSAIGLPFISLFFSLAGNSSMAADVFMTGRSGGAIMMIKD